MTKRINKILWNGTEVPKASTQADGLDGLNLGELFIKNDSQEPGVYTLTTDGKVVSLGGGIDKYLHRLFVAIDANGKEIAPNDTTTPIASVRVNYGLWTEQFLSAKGMNSGGGSDEPTGGATTLGGLRNVTADADRTYDVAKMLVLEAKSNLWSLKNLSELVGGLDEAELAEYLAKNNYAKKSDIPSLKGYATEQWVLGKGYLTEHQDLSAYAKKTDIPTIPTKVSAFENDANYATTSDLDSRIDALVNGAPAAYDTLKEIADVLANNINSIDDILTALGTKVSKDDFNTAIANVNNSISALNTELNGKIDLKLDAVTFNELFEKVQLEDGTWAIKAKLGLFSDGFISAKGSNVGGTSSGGGAVALYQLNDVLADGTQVGGAQHGAVFVYDATIGKWKGVAQSKIVPNLTGYAKESWVLSQGFLTQHQDLSDYAKLTDIPTIPTTDINKGVTAYGWGNHASAGYAMASALGGYQPLITTTNKLAYSLISGTPTSLPASDVSAWAKAASKPTYKFSEITERPTTIGGYGITDAYTKTQVDSALGGYLPLSGGTISDSLTIQSGRDAKLILNNTDGEQYNSISVRENGVTYGYIKWGSDITEIGGLNDLRYNGNTIIHSGNIGSQSVDNADKVDGYHVNASNTPFGGIPVVRADGVMEIGRYIDFHYNNTNDYDFNCRLECPNVTGKHVFLPTSSGTLALLTDNVASATKLATARTIWGKSFDGTGNVSGDLSGVGSITRSYGNAVDTDAYGNLQFKSTSATDNWSVKSNSGSHLLHVRNGGNVGIGIISPQYKLDVNGETRTTKLVIGNGSIEWDETNKGFKIVGGLYTESYLSAKGANTNGGSSSGGGLIESLWKIGDLGKTFNTNANDTFNAYAINAIHNRVSVLEGKATNVSFTQSLTNGTQIGTITIDGASKNIYAPTIPTDDINKGVTAYGWGNHANAGYAMASALGGYLPLTGGTITSSTYGALEIKRNTASGHSGIKFSNNTEMLGILGVGGAANSSYAYKPMFQDKDGKSSILIHSDNYTDYTYSKSTIDTKLGGYLPLSGGVMTGILTIEDTSSNNNYIQFRANRIGSESYADNIINVADSSNTVHARFGIYGTTESLQYIFLGRNKYNELNLRVYSDKVTFGNNTIYHSGNTSTIKTDLGLGSFAYKSSLAFADLTGKPITLSGYGITDGVTAGAVDSADSVLTWAQSNSSYIGSINDGVWYNIISVRHRNNRSDGVSYGMLLYSPLTGNGALKYRQQTSGNWQDERTILDNISFNDYTYSKSQIDTKLGSYLPLSGGTISNSKYGALNIKRSGSTDGYSGISFANDSGILGYIGVGGSGSDYPLQPTFYNGTNSYALIHSGNIGSYSFIARGKISSNTDANQLLKNGAYLNATGNGSGNSNFPTTYSMLLNYAQSDKYVGQISIAANTMHVRRKIDTWSEWKEVAFTDSNVASATKLQTSRKLWGQSFNGENDVNGHLSIGTIIGQVTDNRAELSIVSETDIPCDLWLGNSGYYVWSINCRQSNENRSFSIYHGVLGHLFRIDGASGNVGIGTISPQYKLDVNGTLHASGAVTFDSALSVTSTSKLMGNVGIGVAADNNKLCVHGVIRSTAYNAIGNNNAAFVFDKPSSYFTGIGANGVADTIYFGACDSNGAWVTDYYQKWHFNGEIYAKIGIWSDGYVSAKGQNTSSDMRLKNVLNDVVLGVKDIANAPSMRFAWKNGGGVDVGSSAQYWQKLLPDAVKKRDGMLEMQYANIALLSAIALAKNFETHEERIARLERENKELRNEINMMKGYIYE